jgi:iron complex outermembrane recepter protein
MRFSGKARNGWLASGAAIMALAAAAPAIAQEQARAFDIPAGDLGPALNAYARQADRQILFTSRDVAGRRTAGLRGRHEPQAALDRLLAGSGLAIVSRQNGVLTLGVGGFQSESQAATEVAEVIVTAKTGTQAVRTISGSVTAITGAQLETLGAQSFADYLTRTPGVVFNAGVPGYSTVSIRGVTTSTGVSNNQGPTGYFINDVPLTDPFNSAGIPDVDTFDVGAITVLRGPQGTLFGAASLGGAINYQAAKPNLTGYEAHAQATMSDTRDGATGGAAKLMVNLPLKSDLVAVRGVYVYRSDAGYIDNVGTGEAGSNRTITKGGRAQVAWTPTATTRVEYMYLDQQQDTRDSGFQQPGLAGPLRKSTAIAEPTDLRTIIHNLRVDQDLGFAILTATATHHRKTLRGVSDGSAIFAGLLPGLDPVHVTQTAESEGDTFEVRLASRAVGRFDYLIGGYYDDTSIDIFQGFQSANGAAVIEEIFAPIFGPGIGEQTAQGGVLFQGLVPFHGKELAAFGEASWRVNDQLKLTLGGRAFRTEADSASMVSGFFNLLSSGELSTTLTGDQSQSGFAPKASVTWTPSADLMAYALVSKGFRFGGPNIVGSSPGFPIPPTFGSDSIWNYEVGVRSNWLDNRLQVDVTAFYLDWSDIQLQLFSPFGLTYLANAGKARDYGIEAVATFRPTPALTLQSSLTYLNAELAEDYDPGAGQPVIAKGTVLPGASRWQAANTLTYRWDGRFQPLLVLSHRYISTAPGDFQTGAPVGGYNQFDARGTVHFDRFDLTAFAQNIGNVRGVTSASLQAPFPLAEYVIRPFTVGLTLDFRL